MMTFLMAALLGHAQEVRPLDKQKAEALVQAYFDGQPHDIVVVPGKTEERADEFVVRVQPRKQLETGEPRYAVPGLGPVIVKKSDGSVHPQGPRPPK